MEVHIISKEMVKPSSPNLHLLKPFKLSLLDQLSPRNYNSLIFFYAKPDDSAIDSYQFSDQLKQSLSKSLAQFYPLAGRAKDNIFVSDYGAGVLFVKTRVKGQLSDIVDRSDQELEALNQLLPCKPYSYVPDTTAPLLAVQVNIFDCGGIALGLCLFHIICDGMTNGAFLRSWTAFSRGSNGELPNTGLLEAASRFFPPIQTVKDLKGLLYKQRVFVKEGRLKTRSFVFDADAISTLKLKAKSKSLEHPSRSVALTAFLWKHAIKASRSASGTVKPAFLRQAVGIRHKMKPQLPDYSIGNLHFVPITTYIPLGKDHIELTELASLLKEAMESVTKDLVEGFKTTMEQLDQIAKIAPNGNADFYTFSSWLSISHGKEDFGWGNPALCSIPGFDSNMPKFSNMFVLKNAMQHNAIEAWVTLSQEEMGFLEHDPEFLEFASPTTYFNKSKI